jgi:hypothetical protein
MVTYILIVYSHMHQSSSMLHCHYKPGESIAMMRTSRCTRTVSLASFQAIVSHSCNLDKHQQGYYLHTLLTHYYVPHLSHHWTALLSGTTPSTQLAKGPDIHRSPPYTTLNPNNPGYVPMPSHWLMHVHTDICHAHKSSITLDSPHIQTGRLLLQAVHHPQVLG